MAVGLNKKERGGPCERVEKDTVGEGLSLISSLFGHFFGRGSSENVVCRGVDGGEITLQSEMQINRERPTLCFALSRNVRKSNLDSVSTITFDGMGFPCLVFRILSLSGAKHKAHVNQG